MRALVLGTGLIGASIGAGLRESGWHVSGWDPVASHLRSAADMGALDEALPATPESVDDDLVVLAGPVRAIIETAARLRTPALVTDVAGVKAPVVAAASHLPRFVGGHPMAGRESSGPWAATGAMFRGASWVLTIDGAADSDLEAVEEIVARLGAVPVRMTAADHDAAVAAVSHVPQVVASALVNLVASQGTGVALAAGGFRDLTRIALSEPAWWSEVLIENREPVAGLVGELAGALADWADRIQAGDLRSVSSRLESARDVRRSLAPPVAAVGVILEDRPGEIARVGAALFESEVDIRDLQLRHATRGGGGVLTLSVRPGQQEALRRALMAQRFRLVE